MKLKSFTMKEFLDDAVNEVKGAVSQAKNDLGSAIDEVKNEGDEINEGRWQGLEAVIDDFVRFLIGDRNIALNSLKKMVKSDFMDDYIPEPGKDYNNLYANLFADISKAIKKNTLLG